MENAVEALKIAAGVLLFVLALTVSISCFSQANRAVTSIVSMRDRDTQILYDQIKPSSGLTRVVGVETIIPTIYKAFSENIDIQFKDTSGKDMNGNYIREKDSENNDKIISSIIEGQDSLIDADSKNLLDIILFGDGATSTENTKYTRYKNIHYYGNKGFYNFLKDKTFEEQLGEYYPIDTTNSGSTSTQIKKRVITYYQQ